MNKCVVCKYIGQCNKDKRFSKDCDIFKQTEICQECKKSVEFGSGRFVNRVKNLDTGQHTCEECDNKLRG